MISGGEAEMYTVIALTDKSKGPRGASALLLENWNLPEVLSEPIRFHHTPERAEQYPEICAIIHLADRLAYLEAPPENLAAPTERLAVLDLAPNGTPLNLPALFDYVDDQLDFVLSVLRIP